MSGKKAGGKKGKRRARRGGGGARRSGGARPGGRGAHAPLSLDGETIEELVGLQRTGETWQGGRRTIKAYILEPAPHRPELAVWVEKRSGVVLGSELFKPTRSNRPVLTVLVKAMTDPMVGPPRRPAGVVVDGRGLAVALKPALEPLDITVKVGRTDMVDHMVEALDRSLERDGPEDAQVISYLEDGRVSPGEVARFFEAAARFIRAEPWTVAPDTQVIQVDFEQWGGGTHFVTIMGNAGIELGLIVFRSLDDCLRFSAFADQYAGGPRPPSLPVSIVSLNFADPSELAPHARIEIRKHDWEVAQPDLVPYLLKPDSDFVAMPLTEGDYRLVGACTDAVSLFVPRHRKRFQRRTAKPASEEMVLKPWAERGPVVVSGPHRPEGY